MKYCDKNRLALAEGMNYLNRELHNVDETILNLVLNLNNNNSLVADNIIHCHVLLLQ